MVRKRYGKNMILITVHITEQQLRALDKLVQMRIFPSRSEAIRTAIRELIDRYLSGYRETPVTMGGFGSYLTPGP